MGEAWLKDGCCEADVGLKPNARRQGEERSGRVSGHTDTALLALVASGQGHGLRAGGVHTVDTVYRRRSCARRRIRMRQGLLKHVTPKKSRACKHTATEGVRVLLQLPET